MAKVQKLFDYSVEQKTYEIHGVKIGGQPGLVPTVMVGSMFYNGDKIVKDPNKGIFEETKAEECLKNSEEASDKTGLPSMVDLVAENSEAASKYLDFIISISEMPIFLDVLSDTGQAETLQYASEIGVIDRIILNSLTPHTGDLLYKKIKETKLPSSVILTHSTKLLLSSNKTPIIDEIVPKAKETGIENILIDTAVLDIPTLGLTSKAIDIIKDKYGYPSGCGAHNAISSWKRLKEKYSKNAQNIVRGVTNIIPVAMGADFILYGPIKRADIYFPSVAMIDAAYSQLMIERRVRPSRDHPRYRIG
jgi:tetrahydromethanopterin S-methyltransferase subunit H